MATVAIGFAEYFSYFFPALGTDRILATFAMPWGPWSISAGQLVAAASIVIITAINYVGVNSGNAAALWTAGQSAPAAGVRAANRTSA